MEQVLLVVQVIIAIGLIGMVLIQRSDSDGFGLGGGSGNNLMSGRGAASAMTRITAILATAFIVNSLALGILASRGHQPSIVDVIEEQQSGAPAVPTHGAEKADKKTDAKVAEPKAEQKAAPAVPVEGETKPAPKKAKKPVTEEPSEMDPNGTDSSNE